MLCLSMSKMVVQQADFGPAKLFSRLCDYARCLLLPCRWDGNGMADRLREVGKESTVIEAVFVERRRFVQVDLFSVDQHGSLHLDHSVVVVPSSGSHLPSLPRMADWSAVLVGT